MSFDKLKQFVSEHPSYSMRDQLPYKYEPSVSEDGRVTTYGAWRDGGERYLFDFKLCSFKDGWRQFDTKQDAWYFGVWVHMEHMVVFTYCEGDMYLVECPTVESFKAELKDLAETYGAPPPAAVGFSFDDDKVTRTEFYDKRPSPDELP